MIRAVGFDGKKCIMGLVGFSLWGIARDFPCEPLLGWSCWHIYGISRWMEGSKIESKYKYTLCWVHATKSGWFFEYLNKTLCVCWWVYIFFTVCEVSPLIWTSRVPSPPPPPPPAAAAASLQTLLINMRFSAWMEEPFFRAQPETRKDKQGQFPRRGRCQLIIHIWLRTLQAADLHPPPPLSLSLPHARAHTPTFSVFGDQWIFCDRCLVLSPLLISEGFSALIRR